MSCSLLIIGKKPLPIGGVTIHVSRILDVFEILKLPYSFYNLNGFSFLGFIRKLIKYDNAHLHTSSPLFRLFFVLCCRCLCVTSIITIHGNLGRFSWFYNCCDKLSIKLVDYPIVLNRSSYNVALQINKDAKLMSAYIPPVKAEELDVIIENKLLEFRNKYQFICCSNAYNYSIDKDGQEIYGIKELVDYFKEYQAFGLVLSDPSGRYGQMFEMLPCNVFIINKPHSFIEVLKTVDCYIRNTSTDGDSLSIHEAFDCGVSVIATDVVDRPEGTILIERGDRDKLANALQLVLNRKVYNTTNKKSIDSVELIEFYKRYIYL